MAREEQIFEASKIYSEHVYNQTDFENGFINGAKWADKYPKNPWISVSDKLPFECEETCLTENLTKTVIVNTCLCKKMLAYMIVINDIWVWRDTRGNLIDTVTCWRPIPNIND